LVVVGVRVTTIVSFPSRVGSSRLLMGMVALVAPELTLTLPLRLLKSSPLVAVPLTL
jgi:hypothetical protein